MSSKTITKTSIGIQNPNNLLQWSSGTSPRLAKAKSSPNVSKPLSTPKQSPKPEDRTAPIPSTPKRFSNAGNRSASKTTIRSTPTSKPRNVTVVQIQNESPVPATRVFLSKRQETPKDSKTSQKVTTPRISSPRTPVSKEKKKPKDSPLSCTILEDRALLKKGLQNTPDKLPKKPEELRKKTLNRSTSLWSVPVDSDGRAKSTGRASSNFDQSPKIQKKSLDRTTSLWNVPADAGRISRTKSITGLRPSRIPLSTQHFGLGQSLADLTQVDRTAERIVQRIIDLDEVDRSIDEHIYANCQEAIVSSTDIKNSSPIYENVKNREGDEKKKLSRAKSAPLQNEELERRAQELMSQLDEDDDPVEPSKKEDIPKITSVPIKDLSIKDVPFKDATKDISKSRDELRTKPDILQKTRIFAKSQESLLKKDSEMSIQEIRRNWEMQIKKCQKEEPENERKPNVKKILPLEKSNPTKRKDIVHLVNFFNTKNTESTKEVLQDTWTKIKESGSQLIKDKKEKDEKSSGYVSDGNCSEDSGHMSNENETEEAHQDLKTLEKNKRFLEEIIHDLDHSLEHTIEVFEATPIVQRFAPPEEKKVRTLKSSLSASSGVSSIDSWEETSKIQRGSAEKGNWKAASLPKTNGLVSSSVVTTHRPQIAAKPTPLNTPSQIFFRAGALERLESQRDEKLTGHIILLQARCRGYLARRKLNTLKLQDLAVRCIQRNVRKLMSVREWPWWRLYVKIAPLLNVHRTEDQLKARQEELEILRTKVERLEQERNHLKLDNDKLEAKLSEMTADFAEEHSTSTLAAERIDAETSERLRLEQELQDVNEANKNLQQATERLEMELLYARAADLNGIASDGEDGEDGGVYKQRYEHVMRELEFFKRKMAQQHEDDLEQLVGLKKQLEKKLADAYEEVEEQRQVVGQWKRRVQKLNGEMHDLRLLLEEQTARNNLLEKKQRKFDSETQNLMDDLRQEKAQRERLAREKEIAIAEKFTVEQNLSDARLEIELKEERLHTLTQELEELTFGGKTEEEVAQLKKAKHELEKKCKDQEEELDDLAGQVQLLEQAKLRLEMSIEQQRKEMRKEMQQRDEELEDVRGNAHKKAKSLETQLENEHEERTILLREKHELERRLVSFEEQDRTERAAEAETTQRLKRDLKRTKALLRDAQTMLERSKGDSTGKAALRQLKNQLEDAECARAIAVKAKQALEQDLNETQAALEEASRQRSEAEDRANVAARERTELLSQVEENEEELAEVLKKYRAAVQQVSAEQTQIQECQVLIAALEAEKSSLKDQLTELSQRLESVEQLGDPTANSLATRRLEFRTKELESKLELEQTTRARLETQIARLKESVDKLQTEAALLRTKEQTAQDAARRLQRSLREAKDEATSATAREQEATRARRDVEKALEGAEAETKVVRDDLRLALQRIDDLQSAIQGDLDLDCSEEATSDNSDSD